MSLYASLFRPKATPQSEPMDARQVANNAGGYVFAIDDWARLDRFLVLGSDAPTYYQSARALTRENAKAVLDCLAADAARAVARIVEISVSGRAPKQDPAIFALALATLDEKPETRALAYAARAKSLPHGDAPLPVRGDGEGSRQGLWPRHEARGRGVVRRQAGRGDRLPGDQVSLARGL